MRNKMFEIRDRFNIPGCTGMIVYIKSWHRGLLRGCQLLHVQMNGNPNDIYRVFKWNNGDMNRITKVER